MRGKSTGIVGEKTKNLRDRRYDEYQVHVNGRSSALFYRVLFLVASVPHRFLATTTTTTNFDDGLNIPEKERAR